MDPILLEEPPANVLSLDVHSFKLDEYVWQFSSIEALWKCEGNVEPIYYTLQLTCYCFIEGLWSFVLSRYKSLHCKHIYRVDCTYKIMLLSNLNID